MGDENRAAARTSDRVNLGTFPDMRIGRLTLQPAIRLIRRDDGAEEVIEPRVMQVLLALARASGAIVTRDQLTDSCWEGRVVGEDAVNRVISRLRRVAEGIGAGSFRIETITKIGYRLIAIDAASADVPAKTSPPGPAARPTRRALLIGGGALILGAAGYGLFHRRATTAAVPADAARLIQQAELVLADDNGDSPAAAAGLMLHLTQIHPEIAEGWALLARAYAIEERSGPPATVETMRQRSADAAQRALSIDPANGTARLAQALLLSRRGHWDAIEAACRQILSREPDKLPALTLLATILAQVGRCRERATLLDKAIKIGSPTPDLLFTRVVALWSAGRLVDADQAMELAYQVAPRHYAIWFTRFYLLLYTGRIDQAIGFAEDVDGRAAGIAASEFDDIVVVARAMQSHAPDAVAKARKLWLAKARAGAGHAENSIQFFSALGLLDDAFAVCDASYFGRGFAVSDLRFSREQNAHTRLADRRTAVLFLPSTKALRADPRFEPLVNELGLERYWRAAGVQPDYRAS